MKPQEFIALIASAAQASAAVTGIPPSFTVAQAALESGWGSSLLAREGKNLFGIKAGPSWPGATVTMPTREYTNGAWVQTQAAWRAYPDWQGSIDDHAEFLRRNSRYAKAFEYKTGMGFAIAVASAGYATDPQYANKIVKIIRDYRLDELDTGLTVSGPLPTVAAVAPEPPAPTQPPNKREVDTIGVARGAWGAWRAGQALSNSGIFANRTAMTAAFIGVLSGVLLISKSVGFDFGVEDADVQTIAAGVASVVCVVSQFMHVAANPEAGVQPRTDA